MRRLAIGLALVLATTAHANDGSYRSAGPVQITKAPAGAPEGVREGFWLVALGGDDLADGYRIEPAPRAGDRVAVVAATEDNSRVPVTLELVKRFGGQVVATTSLMEAESFTDWVVEAPFFLRVSIAAGSDPLEFLVGVRVMPDAGPAAAASGDTASHDPTSALPIPEDETAPVPKLVVPAN